MIKSRTMLFALAIAILSVLQVSMSVFTPYLTPQAAGWVMLVVSVAVAVLRVITTTPLSSK